MILLKLFYSFLQIGLFSFGGGYAALPLIQEQVVTKHHWLAMGEYTDLITISQMTPGPIAINAATFVGEQVAGWPGALIATLGVITPSCVIVTFIAWLYHRYKQQTALQSVLEVLRPAVVALIAASGISILLTAINVTQMATVMQDVKVEMLLLFLVCLICLRKLRWNPILVMVLAGVVHMAYAMLFSAGR